MSLLKLQTALTGVLIVTAAGSLSLKAQTPAVTDNSSTSTAAVAVSTTESKKVDTVIKSPAPAESAGSDERSEIKGGAGSSNTAVGTTSSNDTSRAEPSVTAASQGTAAPTDEWQFQLTPYLWIASITGRGGIGNLIVDTDTSVTSSDVELNFGFMATFEARKNKFVFLTDLQYSNLSTERGNPGPLFSSTRASFKTFILDPEIGYRILDNGEGSFVDVLGGIRYWHLNGTIDFRAGILPAAQASRSRSWVDGVAGLRGRAALSERWFVTGKADLGGGGSNFSYQLFGGVGVNLGKRIALIGGYRDLNVNYNQDGFLFDMSLHGPVLGFGFRF